MIILIILIVIISQMVLFSYQTADDKILPGVYVNGLYVGGMTKEKARSVIENKLSDYLTDNKVIIVNGETQLTIYASDISNVDIEALTEQAFQANR